MTASSTDHRDCCQEHDGPHVHGCQLERVDDVQHRGACVTDQTRAQGHAAAEEARLAAMPDPPRVAWLQVPVVDDSERPYPRPHVLDIIAAHEELKELDQRGELPPELASAVRVLLGVVGRLPGEGMAEAFPPPRAKPPARTLTLVGSDDETVS